MLNRGILRDFLVVSSRPCGTFRISNLYPGLRPGLSSAVPAGLILQSMVLTQTLKPVLYCVVNVRAKSPYHWSFYILESADTNVFEAHKVWLCIRARLQSCRTGLKQCWALAPAVFSWPSSATGREKLLSNLVFRAGLATAGAKARILLVCERHD